MGGERKRWRSKLAAVVAAVLALPSMLHVGLAHADPQQVRISYQFGLGFLPVVVVLERNLIEKHARAAGIADVDAVGVQLSGAAITNDSLLSGRIDIASGGIGGLLQLWDKSRGNVKGIVAVNDMSYLLNTNDPSIRSLQQRRTIQKGASETNVGWNR